jgi:DNA-binding HxlR family transcriptional regulator
MKVHHGCPVQATINVLSGKWKVQAVWRLSFGPLRFAELRNLLRGVSEKVLTAQLRELERDGVVNRRALRSSPPKVTYSLSPSGQTLIPVLEDRALQGKRAGEERSRLGARGGVHESRE